MDPIRLQAAGSADEHRAGKPEGTESKENRNESDWGQTAKSFSPVPGTKPRYSITDDSGKS